MTEIGTETTRNYRICPRLYIDHSASRYNKYRFFDTRPATVPAAFLSSRGLICRSWALRPRETTEYAFDFTNQTRHVTINTLYHPFDTRLATVPASWSLSSPHTANHIHMQYLSSPHSANHIHRQYFGSKCVKITCGLGKGRQNVWESDSTRYIVSGRLIGPLRSTARR